VSLWLPDHSPITHFSSFVCVGLPSAFWRPCLRSRLVFVNYPRGTRPLLLLLLPPSPVCRNLSPDAKSNPPYDPYTFHDLGEVFNRSFYLPLSTRSLRLPSIVLTFVGRAPDPSCQSLEMLPFSEFLRPVLRAYVSPFSGESPLPCSFFRDILLHRPVLTPFYFPFLFR